MNEKRIRSFRRNLRRFERLNQLTNAVCCKGITLAQCHVLLEIEALVETTTKQLAENLKLDKSTLSRTVDGLKKLSLVKRGAHAHDRRFTVIRLTKNGFCLCEILSLCVSLPRSADLPLPPSRSPIPDPKMPNK